MAKNKNKKKKKGGYKAPPESPQQIIDALVEISGKIFLANDAGPLWGELHKTFLKSTVDPSVSAKIIMHKDKDELQNVINQLQTGNTVELEEAPCTELPTLTHEEQIEAMRCFRKRVKFLKLDRESKLGIGPLTTGKDVNVDSMMAPHDYPMEVWLSLSASGHLIDDGGGFFHIP